MGEIFQDLNELLKLKTFPDHTYFEEALNYQPEDSKPWDSILSGLKVQLHPWQWQQLLYPPRENGEPQRSKSDNAGFKKTQDFRKELKRVARLAMIKCKTLPEVARHILAAFPKQLIDQNKDVILGSLSLHGLEGYLFVDPDVFGSCKVAKRILGSLGRDPLFVLKNGHKCTCGGVDSCITFGKPLVSKIKISDEIVEHFLNKARQNGLQEEELEQIRKQTSVLDRIKKANLTAPKEEVRQFSGPATFVGFEKAPDTEDQTRLMQAVTAAIDSGQPFTNTHRVLAGKIGSVSANDLIRVAISKTGYIPADHLNASCDLPVYLGKVNFTLVKGKSKCAGCQFFKGTKCAKLGRSIVTEAQYSEHKLESLLPKIATEVIGKNGIVGIERDQKTILLYVDPIKMGTCPESIYGYRTRVVSAASDTDFKKISEVEDISKMFGKPTLHTPQFGDIPEGFFNTNQNENKNALPDMQEFLESPAMDISKLFK